MSEGEVKKCPECGGEMEKGYLFGNNSVLWNKSMPGFLEITAVRGSETILGPSIWVAAAPAYRCLKCKVIILYYGREGMRHE